MGLKKTSRTQRRPTRAAGCYGCWLRVGPRPAHPGNGYRAAKGVGGKARSGLLDRLRGRRRVGDRGLTVNERSE